jgi:hypothetical protein
MAFKYLFKGISFAHGRLVRITRSDIESAVPMLSVTLHIPSVSLFKEERSELGEVDQDTKISFITVFILSRTPVIGFTYFRLQFLGFGFSITNQLSY